LQELPAVKTRSQTSQKKEKAKLTVTSDDDDDYMVDVEYQQPLITKGTQNDKAIVLLTNL